MRSWSIRVWLIALGAVAVLPLLLLSVWFSLFEFEKERVRALARIQETTRALMQAVDSRFAARLALLEGLATSNSLKDGRFDVFLLRSAGVMGSVPPGSALSVSDSSGRQQLNTGVPRGEPLPRRSNIEGIERVFASGEPWISNVLHDAVSGRLVVSLDVPVRRNDQTIRDLGLIVPVEELQVFLKAQKIPAGWYAGIIDRQGVLAARQPFPEQFVGQPSVPALWQAIRGDNEGYIRTRTLDGVDAFSTWSRSASSGWTVAIAVPETFMITPLWQRLVALLGTAAAALVVVALLAVLVGRAITRRLVGLSRAAAAIASHGVAPPPPRGIREIDFVDQAIREAAATIHEQEARQRLLMGELDHRVKNMLATVQALIPRTLGPGPAAKTLTGRVAALARAHALLARTQGRSASLRDIVETTLDVHRGEGGRIRVEGPDILLNPRAAQGLALALHELATNAVKHGALSTVGGTVSVRWRVPGRPGLGQRAAPRLALQWVESGGPPVVEPTRRGFGSLLIERLPQELDGSVTIRFPSSGLVCSIAMPISGVVAEGAGLPPVAAEPSMATDETALAGRRILLVEDAALVAMEATRLLERAGCRIETAATLPTALALAETMAFDAAVLDVNLNGALVFPVAYALRRRGVPFVFLTGYADPQIWPEDLRGERRVGKPVQVAELVAALVLVISAPAASPAAAEATGS